VSCRYDNGGLMVGQCVGLGLRRAWIKLLVVVQGTNAWKSDKCIPTNYNNHRHTFIGYPFQ